MRQLADFEGRWQLARRIRHADGSEALFEGQAVFTPDAEGLVYHEQGTLRMGETAFTAERRYLWRPGLQVWFEDGRFFHTVPPEGGAAEHECPPDHYKVDYDFSDWPCWSCVWQVTGPRKDYELQSRYRRE